MKELQRQFIIDTLLPYKEDRSLCAYDRETGSCRYLTTDGRKCALGQHFIEGNHQNHEGNAESIFYYYEPDKILNEEAKNIGFSIEIWGEIQNYHDELSCNKYLEANRSLKALESMLDIELKELYLN